MPQEITRDDGTKATVYTPEEVETAKTEAATAVKTELAAKETELAAAKEQLAKIDNKDQNFANLRTKVEELEKAKTNLEGDLDKRVQAGVLANVVEESVDRLAGGDKEVKEKIAFHYGKLTAAEKPITKEAAHAVLRQAYLLATAKEPQGPDPFMQTISAAGGAPSSGAASTSTKPPLSEGQKAVAAALGLTPEEITKYDK